MSHPTDHPGTAPDPDTLRDHIVAAAVALGFHRVGIGPADSPDHYERYRAWLDAEYHGSMAYMAAPEHVEARRHPHHLSPTARTVVVVAAAYAKHGGDARHGGNASGDTEAADGPRGFVSRYARGADYHTVMKRDLYRLAEMVSQLMGRNVNARPCVDTAPLLERDIAAKTGLGFIAKNTMLIVPGVGSYVLLGALLLDVDATPTGEPATPRCGSCRLCLDACPTDAFVAPHTLDARRCISYLTIEHRGTIPASLRAAIGTRVFGCDVCQEVCPFNAAAPDRTPAHPELAPVTPDRGAPDLLGLLALGANQRRRYVDGSAMRRVNRAQLVRNVCIALGNAGDPRAAAPLARILTGDRDAIARSHAAWALGQLGERQSLARALDGESDPAVRDEITAALRSCEDSART